MGLSGLIFNTYPYYIEDIEGEEFARLSRGLANRLKVDTGSICMRFLFVIACLFFTLLLGNESSDVLLKIVFISWCMHSYFQSCDSLPPGASKVRQWINAIKAYRFKPATAQAAAFRENEVLFILTKTSVATFATT